MRDEPELASVKQHVERMWARYRPYADRQFLSDARWQFHQRTWEMYLGYVLLQQGLALRKISDAGAEFYIEIGRKKVWVEAIAPGRGVGADAVPELRGGEFEATDVPEQAILLRFTGALAEKRKAYDNAVEQGRIGVDDCYVVAINGHDVHPIACAGPLPFLVKAVLPFGDMYATFDRASLTQTDAGFTYRDHLLKRGGAPVSTRTFLDPQCAGISAVTLHAFGRGQSSARTRDRVFLSPQPERGESLTKRDVSFLPGVLGEGN